MLREKSAMPSKLSNSNCLSMFKHSGLKQCPMQKLDHDCLKHCSFAEANLEHDGLKQLRIYDS